MILQLNAVLRSLWIQLEIALMTTLSRVKNDVIRCIRTIHKEFIDEFININANQYTALIDHNDALIGVGVSRKSALAHAEINLGYEAITNIFIRGSLTAIRLTHGGFEMLVDGHSRIEDFVRVGDLLLSAHFVNSIKQTAGHIDALLKQVDSDNSFSFKIRSRETGDNEPRVFSFGMSLDGERFDGGFVKRAVIEQGAWLSVIPDLMSIKKCLIEELRSNGATKKKESINERY